MRLSTKGRYAVTAMLDLAIREKDGPVTLADISSWQGISLSYLEQLFARLRRAGLVSGVRGPGGGYHLARAADQISIADIIVAVDEKLDTTLCEGNENCQDGQRCLTHELWMSLSERLYDYLETVTLEGFLKRPSVIRVIERQREAGGALTGQRITVA